MIATTLERLRRLTENALRPNVEITATDRKTGDRKTVLWIQSDLNRMGLQSESDILRHIEKKWPSQKFKVEIRKTRPATVNRFYGNRFSS